MKSLQVDKATYGTHSFIWLVYIWELTDKYSKFGVVYPWVPLCLGKKLQKEEKPARQAKKSHPHPSPLSLRSGSATADSQKV